MKGTATTFLLLLLHSFIYAQATGNNKNTENKKTPPNPLTANQQAVQQTIIKMFDALSNRDSVSLRSFCTADITLYEYGLVWNIDTLIMKAITLNQAADFKRTNNFTFITTTTDKSTAWVTYCLNSVITRDGKQSGAQWLETIGLIKEKKQWKVKHLHSTLVKRS